MTSYFNASDVTVANSNHKICYNFFSTCTCAPPLWKGSGCKPLVSKVLQFCAKLFCSDAIIKSQQMFTKLLHSRRWYLTKVSCVKTWEISIQCWRCSTKPLFDAAQDSVTMRLYTSMRYFLTGFEGDETLPMDSLPTINLRRLCRLIGRDSSTTRSTSVLLSWSGWSLAHWTNFAAESWRIWKQWRSREFSRGGFIQCRMVSLYLVCVVCDVIFMLPKPTFWRSLRWSAIADTINTVVLNKVNYRRTQS